MQEIQVGDEVKVWPMLQDGPPRLGIPHFIRMRKYLVVNIIDEDVLLRTVSVRGRYWEAVYEKWWFHFIDGCWHAGYPRKEG